MADATPEPYLARRRISGARLERLLALPDVSSNRLNLRGVAVRVRYRATGSKFEQMVRTITGPAYFPRRYRNLVRVRPPAMLKVNLRNEYPRAT